MVANVCNVVELPAANKHTKAFQKVYDSLFREFKGKLLEEYQMLRTSYQTEFEENFVKNQTSKNNNIEEMN